MESTFKGVTTDHSSSSRSMHHARTSSPPRSSCQFSLSRSRGSTSRSKTKQCFNYKGFRHHRFQCPSKFVEITKKIHTHEDDFEEKVDESSEEMILKAVVAEVEEDKERTTK